ncbi:hypothetical protein [uncultured Jatrophihabitans sp.]|uniref:hypothetical protein n=1 Tax=uncultured Jatrophihabitans sp. TaxID=1610747 RepID=UPI0035CA9AA6
MHEARNGFARRPFGRPLQRVGDEHFWLDRHDDVGAVAFKEGASMIQYEAVLVGPAAAARSASCSAIHGGSS